MSNSPFFSDETAEASVTAAAAKCNSGTIKVYSGSQPTDANTSVEAQTLLGTFSFSATAFGTATPSGTAPTRVVTATANSISDVTAVASGTASWFRALKSDGTSVAFDGSVGTSDADLNLTDTSITSGETMSVSSFSITQPE